MIYLIIGVITGFVYDVINCLYLNKKAKELKDRGLLQLTDNTPQLIFILILDTYAKPVNYSLIPRLREIAIIAIVWPLVILGLIGTYITIKKLTKELK